MPDITETLSDLDSFRMTPQTTPYQRERRGIVIFRDIAETLAYIEAPLKDDGTVELNDACTLRLAEIASLRDDEFPRGCSLDLARDVVKLYIEGGWLPIAEPDCEAPVVHTVWITRV